MDEPPTENDLVIATASKILVVIKPDGRLVYGAEYSPDEAATVFWETFARKRAQAHRDRELVYQHMEKVLVEVGKADLENERAQMRAQALGGIGQQGAATVLEAHRTNSVLEQKVHQIIELGRALAERKSPSEDGPLPGSALN